MSETSDELPDQIPHTDDKLIVTEPDATAYDNDEVFHDGFGRSGFEDADHNIKNFDQPLMNEAIKLDMSKKVAAAAIAELFSVQARFPRIKGEDSDPDEWKEPHRKAIDAEQLVVQCRVAMLNRIIPDPLARKKLLPAIDPSMSANTCVQYRLLYKRSGFVCARQANLPWMTEFPWQSIDSILTSKDTDAVQNILNAMVTAILCAAPHHKGTESLRVCNDFIQANSYSSNNLFFRYINDHTARQVPFERWNPAESMNMAQIVYAANTNTSTHPTTVKVVIGALRMNVCDVWHNPLINRYVQTAIENSSEAAINDGETCTDNKVKVTIVLERGLDIHVLDLSPSMGPEYCSVQHLCTPAESADTGIVELYDDFIDNIDKHAVQELYTLHMSWFHCPGANRGQRLNEQDLAAVHAFAFQLDDRTQPNDEESEDPGEHILPLLPKTLPDPWAIDQDSTDPDSHLQKSTPLAKSARISFMDYDVLVTTYRTANQGETHMSYKTGITVVRYPPPGLHYQTPPVTLPPPRRMPVQRGKPTPPQRRDAFRDLPPQGTAQFFTWVSADAGDRHLSAINLIDHSPSQADTLRLMQVAKTTNKAIWEEFEGTGKWIKSDRRELIHNILNNDQAGTNGETVRQIYRRCWVSYVYGFITGSTDNTKNFTDDTPSYLYIKSDWVWNDLKYEVDIDLLAKYKRYTERRILQDKTTKFINPDKLREELPASNEHDVARFLGGMPAPPGPIAIPRGVKQQTTTPAAMLALMQQMKERIQALEEAKQDEARAEGNTEHLMRQVLNTVARAPSPRY